MSSTWQDIRYTAIACSKSIGVHNIGPVQHAMNNCLLVPDRITNYA